MQILAEHILYLLEKKEITFDEMREIAKYILANTKSLQTEEDYTSFVTELIKTYPKFKSVEPMLLMRYKEESEEKLIKKLSNFITKQND